MKKNIPIIDLLLLGIIVIAAAYFFLIHQPIKNETAALESEITEIQSQLDYTAIRYSKLQTMQNAVDEAFADGNVKALAEYDNINEVIREFGKILSSVDSYSISFGDPVFDSHIARRSINLSFVANSYSEARSIISSIEKNDNRFLIQGENVQFSYDEETGESAMCSVSLSIVGFEYVE